ncbi:MAG: hypothetical protein EB069_11180 [Actinobacteria bacterium]|nr:hypothetical protein [Actinomycetota bacterium]
MLVRNSTIDTKKTVKQSRWRPHQMGTASPTNLATGTLNVCARAICDAVSLDKAGVGGFLVGVRFFDAASALTAHAGCTYDATSVVDDDQPLGFRIVFWVC